MRLRKGKLKLLLLVPFVMLAVLTFVPVPYQVEARCTRALQLEHTYLNCCRILSDPNVQKQLLEATGIQSLSDTTSETNNADPLASPALTTKPDWLANGATINPFTGSYSRSENFKVQCNTDVGVANLVLRQDTNFNLTELEVLTYSLREDTAIKHYRHAMRLKPNGDSTVANLELDIRIQISVPMLFRFIARSRLEQSVDARTNRFATRLLRSVENR